MSDLTALRRLNIYGKVLVCSVVIGVVLSVIGASEMLVGGVFGWIALVIFVAMHRRSTTAQSTVDSDSEQISDTEKKAKAEVGGSGGSGMGM